MDDNHEGLEQFKRGDCPNLKQLKHIMRNEKRITVKWYDIGLELLDSDTGTLEIIKENNSNNVDKCCTEMFNTWLDRKPKATWDQLVVVLDKIGMKTAAENIFKDGEQAVESESQNDNNNGTNGSQQIKRVGRRSTQTKPWIIKYTVIIIVVIVPVVILAIYIDHGLQQKKGDASSVLESTYHTEGNSKEYKVFREYSDELANILPVDNIINKLISAKIITFDDSEGIKGLSKSREKAMFVLNMVAKSLKAGITDDFYSLLRIMEGYEGTVAKVANKIRKGLK